MKTCTATIALLYREHKKSMEAGTSPANLNKQQIPQQSLLRSPSGTMHLWPMWLDLMLIKQQAAALVLLRAE